MNKRIENLFFLIRDNEVIACESNLKDLLQLLPVKIADIRSYDYFYRQFLNSNRFEFEFDKTYIFQKKEYDNGKAIN